MKELVIWLPKKIDDYVTIAAVNNNGGKIVDSFSSEGMAMIVATKLNRESTSGYYCVLKSHEH